MQVLRFQQLQLKTEGGASVAPSCGGSYYHRKGAARQMNTNTLIRLIVLLAICLSGAAVGQTLDQEEFPPNAEPGKCYAKCVIPAEYETYTEQVLSKEASTRLEVVPAAFETTTEQVLVQEASIRFEVIPAVYETVTEQVLVKPASSRLEVVPATYETVTETHVVSPATTRWEKREGDVACLSANPEDCRVWCLVDVPAVTRSVTKRVLNTPATTREISVPAEYRTVTKRVVKTPATTREVEVPAEYASISKTVLATPASTRTIEIPAEYQTVTRTRQTRAVGTTEWREVLCQADVTIERIRTIQRALKSRGYDPGPLDNILGERTRAALLRFQRDNGLPEGSLDLETLAALGVQY